MKEEVLELKNGVLKSIIDQMEMEKYFVDKENAKLKDIIRRAIVILNNVYLIDNTIITNEVSEEIDKAIKLLEGEK